LNINYNTIIYFLILLGYVR